MTSGAQRFRFGPRSTRGLVAGWRSGQILVVAVGTLLALGAVHSLGGIAGAGAGLLAVGVAVAVATWPVAGRPVESWTPTVVRHLSRRYRSRARNADAAKNRSRSRAVLGGLRLLDGDKLGASTIGVLEDTDHGTVSAAVPAGGKGFALLDDAGKVAAVAAWSEALGALASEGSSLHCVQWIATSKPAPGDLALPGGGTSAAASYRALLEETRRRLWQREVLVVLTARKQASDKRRGCASADVLEGMLADLSARLASAGLVVDRVLDRPKLEEAIGSAFDLSHVDGNVDVDVRWHALRTGGSWHATYWVAEWPRGEVGPAILVPLLVGGEHRRTVTVTMRPLPPVLAVRRAERERTAGASDAELRRRHGFSETARSRAEQDLRLQREAELARGHAAFLFNGFVSVTAADEAALRRACVETEQAAALCQLELRRLFGQQHESWLCTLPAGRGRP